MVETSIEYSGTTKEVKDKDGNLTEAGGVKYAGTVTMDMPGNIDEAVEAYGHDAVYDSFKASLIIDAQRICRANHPDAQAAINDWQPGQKIKRGSTGISYAKLVQALKDKPELKEQLKALLGG